jgi:hypothetical protein
MKEKSQDHDQPVLVKSNSTRETYNNLCDLLDNHNKVHYLRFGDGDLFIMMERNENVHDYNEKLGKELYQSLAIDHPRYLRGLVIDFPYEWGMTKGIFEKFYYNDEMRDFIIEKFKITESTVFESALFPLYYSVFRPKEMNRFLDKYIRPKRKMFIGSIPELEMRRLFSEIEYYIPIPAQNAYASMDSWWPEVLKHIDDVDLVIPAAGVATRVISKRLWELDKEVVVIDFGSIVDGVSSLPSTRKWLKLKRHVLNRILLPEFRDNSLAYWVRYLIKETGFLLRYAYYKMDPLKHVPILSKAKWDRERPYEKA